MRIGVTFPQPEFSNDPIAIRDYAQTVESLGFRHILVYDHVLSADLTSRPGWTGAYNLAHPFHEVFVLLGYVAAVTTNLELVTGVLILPQRQTALVAKQAAEVDVLSGGRLRLGVGVGWNKVEYDGLGKTFGDRGARSEEQIALLRALWTEPSVSFEGRWERVIEAGINPLPVQRPIPVWIGGYAEATLRRVGRIGDGWFPWREPNETMRDAVRRLRAYAVEAGRDPDAIGLEPQLNVGRGDPEAWRTFLDGWRALGATHLCLSTMGNGFTTPAEHLAALSRAAHELGVAPE
ncbi:MAG TPA: LLM class F420-dependent oxidoreductase [Thermomicrobiales bacterium]|nr:LLM class F420-dependent oxidoreductase [Thermomicrobiales bacterium]